MEIWFVCCCFFCVVFLNMTMTIFASLTNNLKFYLKHTYLILICDHIKVSKSIFAISKFKIVLFTPNDCYK